MLFLFLNGFIAMLMKNIVYERKWFEQKWVE